MDPLSFKTDRDLVSYYDDRYSGGYMDVWNEIKRQCVRDILASIPLSKSFRVLDYGCGSGFFTRFLGELFPEAVLVGIDLSPHAIELAKERDNRASYFVHGDRDLEGMKQSFDLIFSHHVLEHVFDLNEAAADIASFAASNSRMLHILPCSNPGSFEFEICSLYEDGIDSRHGNRFFCEDPSHLRRLSSQALIDLFQGFDFSVEKRFFMNQYWGSLNWLTESSPSFIRQVFDPKRTKSQKAKLIFYRILCQSVFLLRYARKMRIRDKFTGLDPRSVARSAIPLAKGSVALSAYPIAWLVDQIADGLTRREWNRHQHSPNGSEMALVFQRGSISNGAHKL